MKLLLALLLVTLTIAIAYATGPLVTGDTTTATATASATGGAAGSATSSSGGNDQTNRSYGVGGTGLTSTAPCLGSLSLVFGLGAGTHVETGCVIRYYAAMCKDDACRKGFACIDPDLPAEAKTVLGCKP